ncbi:MAG: C-GCAxxG-C-C family protein [Oscillospiraceae bacterium]|nr:C-GCAxxG-C-C family protein [Oscillospiraceae bacterium]
MLKQEAEKIYLEQDYNCAETVLAAANIVYALGLSKEDIKLVSAFGGGMGCGSTCGALCSALAALGKKHVTTRAHATEGFKDLCANLVADFEQVLGSTDCEVLVQKYKTENTRCLATVLLACDVLEKYM